MSQRVVIFANPVSGRGRGRALAERLAAALPAAGYAARVVLDRPGVSTTRFDDLAAVISIGGDGSLRAVVEAILASGKPPPPVLVVPMGTANLMGRHLGARWTGRTIVPAVLQTLRDARVVRLDAARANGRVFLSVAGAGIDGHVVHLLDAVRSGPIRFASYLLPAALTFANYEFPPIEVAVDGRVVFQQQPGIVFIGNVKEYGIGLPILTRAVPDDGLLDVCVMPCRNRMQIVELLLLVATGEQAQHPDVVYLRGRHVSVTSPAAVPVQIDGDSSGFTPLEVEVLPAAVPVLLPASVPL